MKTTPRVPAVAGRFYAATPGKLQEELEQLFTQAREKECNNVRAIISPHAGYVFSGGVAASAFNQIDARKKYKRIFVIGSSHHVSLQGAAVYTSGDFLTPLGVVAVDTAFCGQLAADYPDIFVADSQAHRAEHSIEVQLPFLQHLLGNDFVIIPVIIGTSRPAVCKRIAEILAPYLGEENLFVISTDFSHYPPYNQAVETDARTKDAILTNNPDELLRVIRDNESSGIPHLATCLCGWTSVLTLLYMTAGNKELQYVAIDYKNSGDAPVNGERDQVVGYWGIAVCDSKLKFSAAEEKMLLDIARQSMEQAVITGRKSPLNPPPEYPGALQQPCGAFVTLRQHNQLRGCIGRIQSDVPLYMLVSEMAVAAALYDDRFAPVTKKDLEEITIDITVLSPLEEIHDVNRIETGRHGILIKGRGRSGVFLPQVATETGWSREEFLGHCSRDKAGLGWDGWKTARIFIFTGTIIAHHTPGTKIPQ
ncbi:MAG: AmmeMemoRadiSam system protein B [Bacteroidales bacterium]|nr:AmmeMemoRadiSam system protein B [Bacteroidales bacterium]MDD4029982.1 AmmeMemoRadiSam system protein B [Bacteroidales bacterium]MDD4434757.1 AmmeMemoRadiSam system protein B [Bacteroidales bacterium]MDD5732706.1 AmmeMemoRadiSam system protein B [Bacteroidales bacterium]